MQATHGHVSMSLNQERTNFVDDATPPSRPERRQVASALLNFWLDVALGLAVALVVWLSAMLQIVFPAPTTAAGWTLWGLTYDQWRDVQFIALCVSVLLVLEHVVLHWSWVCGVVATKVLRLKQRPGEGVQAMYGIAAFIGLMLAFNAAIVVALFTVKRP